MQLKILTTVFTLFPFLLLLSNASPDTTKCNQDISTLHQDLQDLIPYVYRYMPYASDPNTVESALTIITHYSGLGAAKLRAEILARCSPESVSASKVEEKEVVHGTAITSLVTSMHALEVDINTMLLNQVRVHARAASDGPVLDIQALVDEVLAIIGTLTSSG